ncbi:tetratricopeptide repeat protein [Dethiothermospora halolimnae]|uniref:tetratricopeptide repeat protein n=1 Tax=Dethiothermospora halolimnae TaxID=3114390 RepID=UPI003CCC2927
MTLLMKLIVAERLFFLKKYEESREKFKEILKEKVSKRIYLNVLYRLAQIDDKIGDVSSSKDKYKKILDEGNKLWIAEKSKEHLSQMLDVLE